MRQSFYLTLVFTATCPDVAVMHLKAVCHLTLNEKRKTRKEEEYGIGEHAWAVFPDSFLRPRSSLGRSST